MKNWKSAFGREKHKTPKETMAERSKLLSQFWDHLNPEDRMHLFRMSDAELRDQEIRLLEGMKREGLAK